MSKRVSRQEAVSVIESGERVFVHGGAATPLALIDALVESASARDLRQIEMIHLHTFGDAKYAAPEYSRHFKVANLFVGGNMRTAMGTDHVDYCPVFLSEIPHLFRSGRRRPNVAMVHVSPPDENGFCSLGTSVDVARAAVESADHVIAQINPRMPRTHGDSFVHIDRFAAYIEIDAPLPTHESNPLTDVERAIGRHTSELVDDGATLQMGIGAVPDAVLAELTGHKHLGVHTEMWSDHTLDLIERGVIDNSQKKKHAGRSVSAFVMGTQRVYDHIHDNPSCVQLDVAYVNNPVVIAKNPKVTAINSAVEVDLTGQVCADSIGHRIISGVGGQMDFIRGAAMSDGGKPIIALPSRTKRGASRLVSSLNVGAGVITTRAHVHYLVTEYGSAYLFGMTLNERARAIIELAHPDDREPLDREWHEVRNQSH